LPEVLRGAPNLVVTPHVAGFSPDALRAAADRIMANLAAFFDGRPVIGRVN
jgi:lactate dehydrogenase-like 2-hydroxyacid dehydrogenase